MMRDPYEVLGVQKNASAEAIKTAFRRLAKKLHPDANRQDKKAASKFAEINAAYEILGEESKRKAFDRGEIDADGKPRFQGFEGFGAGGDPRARGFGQGGFGQGGFGQGGGGFESFTFGPEGFQRSTGPGPGGGGGGFRGGIDEILKGMFGGGTGGPGRRPQFAEEEFETPAPGRDVTGAVTISLAEAAKGTTRRVHLPSGKEIEAKIPPGLADGQTIRLKGQGLRGPDGNVGDALITVSIAPHPQFARDGANLRLELPITLYEAVLGAKVRAPTLDGAVELAIPPGTNSGRTFRLKGKGLAAKSGPGDLYVTVSIMLPEQSDAELEALMRKWRDQKPYDPRKE